MTIKDFCLLCFQLFKKSDSNQETTIPHNPYNCTEPGNLFTGYEYLRDEILKGFLNGKSYALIGGRRCGKTSFLIQIEKDLSEKNIGPFHPLPLRFSIPGHSGELTSESMFKNIYQLIARKIKIPEWQNRIPDQPYENFKYNLDIALPLLKKNYGPDWLVILLIDEMDNATGKLPDDQFFQNLRHFLMESRFHRHFRLLATGVKGMADLIASGSPLNNLLNKYLRIFTEPEARALVNHGFPEVSGENLPFLFELTGRHPYLLQGILEKLWDEKTIWNPVTIKDIGEKFLCEHKDFEHWLKRFELKERNFYRCLADQWPGDLSLNYAAQKTNISIREAREALTPLSYHGIIDASDTDHLKIAGTLFRDWYLDNFIDKTENRMKIFISYATEDFETANRICFDLKQKHVSPWLDRHDLLPGQNWKFAIRQAIKTSDYYLILLSSKSVSKRGFVQKEMRMALDILDEFPESGSFIIPVRLDKCEPPDERFQNIHTVDMFPSYEDGLNQLLRVFCPASTSNNTPVPATPSPATLFDSSRKIRILFMEANPVGTGKLRLDEEFREIKAKIQQSEFRDRFDLVCEWAVRVDDIMRCLMSHKPDIVHFSGHGEYGEILLENNDGTAYAVPAGALSKLFSLLKDNIRCVVLNACYTEPQAKSISEHIDYVVGMSTAIKDKAAINFASSFYQALGFGRDIETAFKLGCLQIEMKGLNEQDTPKLLKRP